MSIVWFNFVVALLLTTMLIGRTLGIVRGTPVVWPSAGKFQFPYMASLHYNKENICGAVIIKTGVALTAAHCVEKFVKSPNDVVIRAGSIDLLEKNKNNFQKSQLKRIKLHEEASKFAFDIAVIVLVKPFTFDQYVGKVNLPTIKHNGQSTGKIVTAIGFGYTETGVKATKLQQVSLKVTGFQTCKRTFEFLDPSMICMSGDKIHNVCHGDSGGPVVQHFPKNPSRDLLIGITSYVINSPEKDCDPEYPATAVNVPVVREWIDHWAKS